MANEIDALNRGLRRTGQPVTLRKVTGTTSQTYTDVVCQAVVRGYTPTELIAGSGIIQQDSKVILSPTEINAAVWPSAQAFRVKTVAILSGSTARTDLFRQALASTRQTTCFGASNYRYASGRRISAFTRQHAF
jgi:hypothetical protein